MLYEEIKEPLQVAYVFAEKRTGRPASSIGFVNSKDVETAKQLLTKIDFEEMPAFFDYALAEARATRFDVQTLDPTRVGALTQIYISMNPEKMTTNIGFCAMIGTL